MTLDDASNDSASNDSQSNDSQSNDSRLSVAHGAFRFAIEVVALIGWALVGWNAVDSPVRWLLAIGLPAVAAAIWGTFRVPNDLSANGAAPVPVPGLVRLFIEFDILMGAAVLSALVWRPAYGIALGVAVVAHYAMTSARVRWLLAEPPLRAD